MLVTYLVQCLVYTGKPYLGRGDEASPPPPAGRWGWSERGRTPEGNAVGARNRLRGVTVRSGWLLG